MTTAGHTMIARVEDRRGRRSLVLMSLGAILLACFALSRMAYALADLRTDQRSGMHAE